MTIRPEEAHAQTPSNAVPNTRDSTAETSAGSVEASPGTVQTSPGSVETSAETAAVPSTEESSAAPQPGRALIRAASLRKLGRGTQLLPAWLVPFLALIIVTTYFGITGGSRFLSLTNFSFLLQQTAVVAIPAFGVTLIIISGSIDLSVGSVVGLAGMIGALVGVHHGTLLGLGAAIVAGVCAGLFNGIAFAVLKVPSFIVTLGMLSIARGITVKASGSQPVSVPDGWLRFGQEPGIFVVFGVCLAGTAVLLHLTSFGRRTVALGGQERVARLSGIPVTRTKILLFCFGGLMAALGGIVLASRVGAATPDAATGFELTAIAAVVLGGTPLTGGIGNVVNTVVGALILSMLLNGMIIDGVSSQVQLITQGLVLVGAVLLSLDRAKIGIIK